MARKNNQGDVRFVRIGGRIVPIRSKKGSSGGGRSGRRRMGGQDALARGTQKGIDNYLAERNSKKKQGLFGNATKGSVAYSAGIAAFIGGEFSKSVGRGLISDSQSGRRLTKQRGGLGYTKLDNLNFKVAQSKNRIGRKSTFSRGKKLIRGGAKASKAGLALSVLGIGANLYDVEQDRKKIRRSQGF